MLSAYDETEWFNRPLGEISGHWFIGFVIARHERRVARALRSIGCESFIPMDERVQRSPSGQRHRVRVPLFDSYVFFAADDFFSRADLPAKARGSFLQLIPVIDQPRLHRELKGLEKATASGLTGEVFRHLHPGKICRVLPPHKFQGMEGELITRSDRRLQFVICIHMLGTAVMVDIPPEFLELVETSAA